MRENLLILSEIKQYFSYLCLAIDCLNAKCASLLADIAGIFKLKYGWSCSSLLLISGSKNTLDMKTIRQDINFNFYIFQRLNVRLLKFYKFRTYSNSSYSDPVNKNIMIENKNIFYQ